MNDRLRAYLQNPPAGSAARRAIEFGIDLSLTYRNMFELSMAERLQKFDEHVAAAIDQRGVKPRPLGKIPE